MLATGRTYAVGFATALLASGAMAAHADVFEDKCLSSTSASHGGQEDWRDLGNGYVAYKDYGFGLAMVVIDKNGSSKDSEPSSYGSWLTVEACSSGRKLVVKTFDCASWDDSECSKRETSIDIVEQADKLLDEAASADSKMSFTQLANRFRALSKAAVIENGDGNETCACRVAYPELRGNKTKYQY